MSEIESLDCRWLRVDCAGVALAPLLRLFAVLAAMRGVSFETTHGDT